MFQKELRSLIFHGIDIGLLAAAFDSLTLSFCEQRLWCAMHEAQT